MRRFLPLLLVPFVWAVVFLVAFAGTAHAADAVTSTDSSMIDLLRPVFDAFSGGHYAYAAALLTVFLAALVKRYAPGKLGAFTHTDAGGSLLALVMAMGTAMSVGLAAPGAVVTLALVKSALLIGVGAAGGYAVVKNLLIEPVLLPLAKHSPAWLKPLLSCVTWVFDHSASDSAQAALPDPAAATAPALAQGK